MAKLEDLLVNEDELDREVLATGLAPFLRIGREGQLRPTPGYSGLPQKAKVVAVLLGAKAAHVLDLRPSEALTFGQVVETSGVASGTVGRVLRELAGAHLAEQDRSGAYFVPAMTVLAAIALLGGAGKAA